MNHENKFYRSETQVRIITAQPGYQILRFWREDDGSYWLDYPMPVVAWSVAFDEGSDETYTDPVTIEHGTCVNFESQGVLFPDGRLNVEGDRMFLSVSDWIESLYAVDRRLGISREVAEFMGISLRMPEREAK